MRLKNKKLDGLSPPPNVHLDYIIVDDDLELMDYPFPQISCAISSPFYLDKKKEERRQTEQEERQKKKNTKLMVSKIKEERVVEIRGRKGDESVIFLLNTFA